MSGGSLNLRQYRIARRDGATIATACVLSGISMDEARLIEADDLRNPPPPECFQLLQTPAPVGAPPEGNDDMARAKKAETPPPISGEIPKPDFERAIAVILGDLNPLTEESAKTRGEQAAAWKVIEKDCRCNKKAMKAVHSLMRMDPELRNDYLRTLYGGMEAAGIGITVDLVDKANGNEAPQMPTAQRQRPKLATVPTGPYQGDDADLNPDDDAPAAEIQQAAE